MSSDPDPVVILGFCLWVLAFAVFFGLRKLINMSLEVEAKIGDGNGQGITERGSALKSLHVAIRVIIWAISPFAVVVLGHIFNVQQIIKPFIPAQSLVAAALAALFSFWPIYLIRIDHDRKNLMSLLRPRQEGD